MSGPRAAYPGDPNELNQRSFRLCRLSPRTIGEVLIAPAQAQSCVTEFADNFEFARFRGDILASMMYDAQDGNGPRLYVARQFSRAGGKLCNGVAL